MKVERHGFMGVKGYHVKGLSFTIGEDTQSGTDGSVKVTDIDGAFRWIAREEFEIVVAVLRLDELADRNEEN